MEHLPLPSAAAAQEKKEKKTNALLFAYVDDHQALLLDTDTHRDLVFADEKWLIILYRNWPEIMAQWQIKG